MEFSSPSLQAETKLTLGSKVRREIIVNADIAAGAQPFWKERLENGTITNGNKFNEYKIKLFISALIVYDRSNEINNYVCGAEGNDG